MEDTISKDFHGLVLAAGMGKRLRSGEGDNRPKVLRQVNGRYMILYALDALRGAGVADICLVVGAGADMVKAALSDSVEYAYQEKQLGSGHATASARSVLEGKSRHILLMCGDSPLFTSATVSALKAEHIQNGAIITLASAELDDPTGYGRIIRRDGKVAAIVEEKCASAEEKAIKEINGGCYAFDSKWLWSNIDRIQPNETGEICLTDLVQFAIEDGEMVATVQIPAEEVLGVNTPEQLKQAEEILRSRGSRESRGSRGKTPPQPSPKRRGSLSRCIGTASAAGYRCNKIEAVSCQLTADSLNQPSTLALSVVTPAYNEETRIGDSIRAIAAYLSQNTPAYEIIVVNDGSSDSTLEILQKLHGEIARLTILTYSQNMGKGYAVRQGMLAAKGDWVLMTDADLAAPIEELPKLEEALRNGADLAVGSRATVGSVREIHQPFYRELGGQILNLAIQAIAVWGIRDTQCGFKLFTRECAQAVFPKCFLNDFSFDVEVIYLARKLGFKVKEVGVRWYHREGSKVHPIRDGIRLLVDLFRIRTHKYGCK
ncbi:MAG: glycosyltransferase [Armatimonadota bacterium]|nr:glycosyltransferase [Armatimonadota bacterium]